MRELPNYSYFALKRPGAAITYMHLKDGLDPMTEALKGGAVESLTQVSEAEAAAIDATLPKSEAEAPAASHAAPNNSDLILALASEIDDLKATIQANEEMIAILKTVQDVHTSNFAAIRGDAP